MSTKTGTKTPSRKCPVTNHTTDQEDFAPHDFTTQGRPSNLDCPFAKFAPQNGLPETPESHDPIAAEFHQDQASVNASTSASGPLGRCPIRFLDKHSPEEITAYFENHKHELPRSHQVCVQRYQRNEAGAKQLDARFGSLTNMIQGLGRSHKPYLPEDEKPVKQEASSSAAAVEKWAETVGNPDSVLPQNENMDEDNQRRSHFERPLREIRVGESPSRPWGISVPVTKDIPVSAMNSDINQQPPLQADGTASAPAIPGNTQNGPGAKSHIEEPQSKHQNQPVPAVAAASIPPTQIIFNGPVFFGYTPDDAAAFLKLLNIQGSAPGQS